MKSVRRFVATLALVSLLAASGASYVVHADGNAAGNGLSKICSDLSGSIKYLQGLRSSWLRNILLALEQDIFDKYCK